MHKLVPRLLWCDSVVPLGADVVAFEVKGFELGVGDFDFGDVVARVEFGGDLEAGASGGAAEQGQELGQRAQRFARPVQRDEAEQAVFDPIPFRAAGGIVADGDRQAGLIGEALLPPPSANSSRCRQPTYNRP